VSRSDTGGQNKRAEVKRWIIVSGEPGGFSYLNLAAKMSAIGVESGLPVEGVVWTITHAIQASPSL